MSTQSSQHRSQALVVGALAGLAGGLAEIGWVALYSTLSGTPATPVARGIVEAVIPALAPSSHAAEVGILIHLGLAIALGISLVLALHRLGRRRHFAPPELAWVTLALATVWAVNFFVVLPQLSPGFVRLLPYGATLLSKLLFGVFAALVLRAKRVVWVG